MRRAGAGHPAIGPVFVRAGYSFIVNVLAVRGVL